jgi:hypothetical protein
VPYLTATTIRDHIETDLDATALGRIIDAAVADMNYYAGELDPLATTYTAQLARRNALLIDLVKLAITYNAVHVQAIGQVGATGTSYHAEWTHLLRRIKPAVVS